MYFVRVSGLIILSRRGLCPSSGGPSPSQADPTSTRHAVMPPRSRCHQTRRRVAFSLGTAAITVWWPAMPPADSAVPLIDGLAARKRRVWGGRQPLARPPHSERPSSLATSRSRCRPCPSPLQHPYEGFPKFPTDNSCVRPVTTVSTDVVGVRPDECNRRVVEA